jgi:hypothetical protein
MILNNYLNITNYGSKEFEYCITFKDEVQFYKDIKNQKKLYWDFGDGINDCNIELANIVAGFIRPYLPFYTKLILKTIYLKYQRQERPTIDCRSDLLSVYINQFNYDFIEVPYIHNCLVHPKIITTGNAFLAEDANTIVLPDEGMSDLHLLQPSHRETNYDKWLISCKKVRVDGKPITSLDSFDLRFLCKQGECTIVDDIIAGGDSVLNVIKIIREANPKIFITVECIFLMSQYGVNKIHSYDPSIKIKPLYKLFLEK